MMRVPGLVESTEYISSISPPVCMVSTIDLEAISSDKPSVCSTVRSFVRMFTNGWHSTIASK